MLNSICSPEMSFNSRDDVENQPHAYVAFSDGAKSIVRLDFVKEPPINWRDPACKWDRKYLHKVFWSPNEEDTPNELLKTLAEIPVYERRSSFEKPGYYRAILLDIKETLADLEAVLDSAKGKRLAFPSSKSQYTSFSETTETKGSTSKNKATGKKKEEDSKPIKLKKKRHSKMKIKKTEINVAANSASKLELRNDLASRYPHLIAPTDAVSTSGNSSSDEGPPLSDLTNVKASKSLKVKERHQGKEVKDVEEKLPSTKDVPKAEKSSSSDKVIENKLIKNEGSQRASDSSSCGESDKVDVVNVEKTSSSHTKCEIPTILKTPSISANKPSSRKRSWSKSKRGTLPSSSDSSQDELYIHGKKFRVDPDFTPKKYEEAKSEISMLRSANKRLSDLNLRLQEKVGRLEDEAQTIMEKVTYCQTYHGSRSSPYTSGAPNSGNWSVTDVNPQVEKKDKSSSKKSEGSTGKNAAINSICGSSRSPGIVCRGLFKSPKKELKSTTPLSPDYKMQEGNSKQSSKDQDDLKHISENTDEELNQEFGIANLCEAELHDEDNPFNALPSNDDPDALQLCTTVVIPGKLKLHIWNIPSGPKKDIQFVKELSIAAFGPETLCASSIQGTRKGGKKREDGEQREKKPPLDKDILQAIQEQLCERVAKELGISVHEASKQDRCSMLLVHRYIRDQQKKYRGFGYGVGKMENKVSVNLLKMKSGSDKEVNQD